MKILLSIRPEFTDKILKGIKTIEYRKSFPHKHKEIQDLFIYSTMPVGKIVAVCKIENVLVDEPKKVWEKTKHLGGINKEYFDKYYASSKKAYAIKISKIKMIEPISFKGLFTPPQSYCYINDRIVQDIQYQST